VRQIVSPTNNTCSHPQAIHTPVGEPFAVSAIGVGHDRRIVLFPSWGVSGRARAENDRVHVFRRSAQGFPRVHDRDTRVFRTRMRWRPPFVGGNAWHRVWDDISLRQSECRRRCRPPRPPSVPRSGDRVAPPEAWDPRQFGVRRGEDLRVRAALENKPAHLRGQIAWPLSPTTITHPTRC
jgi:hypothetical protein